jgi:hypothetical protein
MGKDDDSTMIDEMREALLRRRTYADFFDWPANRQVAEEGVAADLADSLQADGHGFFTNLRSRGRGLDPPDCEALTLRGERLAIEVTELVSGEAIKTAKAGRGLDWAPWSPAVFLEALDERLRKKAEKFAILQGGPYPGGYVVVVYTDEPLLSRSAVQHMLSQRDPSEVEKITRAFLLLSYDPAVGRYPYFELAIRGYGPVTKLR